MTRLGRRQLAALAIFSRPGSAYVIPAGVIRSLCRRGLLERRPGAGVHITASFCPGSPGQRRAILPTKGRQR